MGSLFKEAQNKQLQNDKRKTNTPTIDVGRDFFDSKGSFSLPKLFISITILWMRIQKHYYC